MEFLDLIFADFITCFESLKADILLAMTAVVMLGFIYMALKHIQAVLTIKERTLEKDSRHRETDVGKYGYTASEEAELAEDDRCR